MCLMTNDLENGFSDRVTFSLAMGKRCFYILVPADTKIMNSIGDCVSFLHPEKEMLPSFT